MNLSFKLGRVAIPVSEENNILIEGLEVSVSDYNLMEGLEVVKSLPGIMFELRQVMEMDLSDAPSAEDLADKKDKEEEEMGFAGHPLFGGIKVVKVKKGEQHPLEALLKGQGGNGKAEHPLAGLFKKLQEDLNK